MKRLCSISIISTLVFCILSSCGKLGAGTTEAIELSYIPGECLRSNILKTCLFDAPGIIGKIESFDKVPFFIYTSHKPKSLSFPLEMELDVERESLSHQKGSDYRYYPSSGVYKAFGKESKNVENAYEAAYSNIKNCPDWLGGSISLSSIFYCEGLVITANKDFAGIPAGENIASIAEIDSPFAYYRLPFVDFPNEYLPLGRYISVLIPLGDYQFSYENVRFHFEIPVKVGLFLHYLKDKISDPNAEMQFKDEVLTCDFSMSIGLH